MKKFFSRQRRQWILMSAYLLMFVMTGYLAFIIKDPGSPLMQAAT